MTERQRYRDENVKAVTADLSMEVYTDLTESLPVRVLLNDLYLVGYRNALADIKDTSKAWERELRI